MPAPLSFTFPDNYGEKFSARDRFLERFKSDTALRGLGTSVSRVVQLASSEDEDTYNLANYVLSDVALTQRVLRMSNTVCYRTASNTPVTTVSRAIFMLGFDTVKTSALALLLVDNLKNDKHADIVRGELANALCASLLGRELARRSHYQGAEEAAIAALFKNLGRLLVVSHDYDYYCDIMSLIADGTHTPSQASTQVLGVSFDGLAESVLQEWNIPEAIVGAIASVGNGVQKTAKTRAEWMRQVAAFSTEAVKLVSDYGDGGRLDEHKDLLLARFGVALNLDREKLDELLENVNREINTLAENLKLGPARPLSPHQVAAGVASTSAQAAASIAAAERELELEQAQALTPIREPEEDSFGMPSVLAQATMASEPEQESGCHPSGKPFNARDMLLAGVQEVTQMRASGCRVNELIMLTLETLFNSMGFRFAVVCLKDAKTNTYRSRLSLGENHVARQAGFHFPATASRDLFHLAMENDADLMIADATSIKIRDLLPTWHRVLLPDARSFIVLPLVVQKARLGLFYFDRTEPAPEGVPPDETALIKALKNQVLAMLMPH
jgi:HD-like signal output (HDOD) protein